MTVDELKRKVDAGETPVVLDVREESELRIARFPFPVIHIPMRDLPARVADLPKGVPIVCACRSGSRSAQVTHWLIRQGLDAVNLEGGILAWARQIDPTIRQY
ncbi:MAG: rhodanese-like domain-containing protein [Thermoanaerobaculia bacterium]